MRILLVDDDVGVVQALLAILKTIPGHAVRIAGTGDQALAAAAELGGLDLLITDVVMEPMDGFTLRDHLVGQYPALRTILISGFDLSDYPEQTQNHQLLAKPVDADTLRAAVAAELPPVAVSAPEPAPVAPIAVAEPVAAPELAPVAPIAVAGPVVALEPAPAAPIAVAVPVPAPEPAPVAPIAVAVPVVAPEPVPAAPIAVVAPDAAPEPAPAAPEPAPAAPVAVAVPTAAPEPTPAAASAPVPVARPIAIPTPKTPVPVPVARPTAVPAPTTPVATPVAKPTAVPVPTTPAAHVALPVARPTVVAKAIPTTPAAAAPPTAIARPTVRATAVPAPSVPQPTLKAQAVPAIPPTVTMKATAVPRPSAIVPSPVAVPKPATASTPPAPPPPTDPTPSGAAPGLPTVRMAATVRAQPVPPPSTPGGPTPVARPGSAVAPRPSVPVAKPKANPGSQMKPAAVPTSAPRSGALQTQAVPPTPAPRPTVAPVSAPGTVIAPLSSLAPAAVSSGEDLSGQMLGAYQLLRKQGEGRWGSIYAGVQTSINRPVALEILDVAKATDPVSQSRFVADARAKAAVQHPSILAVYEAGEADGRFFYAYEYVDGQNIAELKTVGQRLDETTALKVLRVAADGLAYFNVNHTPHTPPDATSVFLGADGQPRLANLATQLADEQLAPPQEIQALGRVMLGVLPAIQSLSPGLRDMLKRMVQPGPQALTAWVQLLQGIKSIEPRIVPTDAAKISAHDRAAIAAVDLARKQQKKSLYYSLGSMASMFILIGVCIWFLFFHNKQRIYDEQIHIPAGEFLFANGEKKTLPDFWIDKYEVTYGQYSEFVKALEARPTTEFDHPQQPRIKNSMMHKTRYWDIYYGNAEQGRAARSIPIDLSCPVGEVDFWDAYAYAKWKGRELPTEQEWEKAARGTKGLTYPWGEEFDPKKVNSNADYNEDPLAKAGQIDGYSFWNPVDKIKADKSPFGVIGMAGNVREWTGTWEPVKKRPIIKGGSFMSSDVTLPQRTDVEPSAISEALGFRTVTHSPPSK